MSAFEQKVETTFDKSYQFLLFAAEPYEIIAFKVPSVEIDKSTPNFFSHWDPDSKMFTLQLYFKASWLNQHSAPTSSVSFSPSNDKIITSVGLDMKLYTFDSGSRKPTSSISYEAPFSSLSFTDDGLTLAAGTSTGKVVFYDVRGKPQPITVLRAYANSEAVTNLCWQRSKHDTCQ